jgi:cell division protein FtsQ
MNLALLEEKNLVDVWKQKETRQRKSRKKDELSIRKSKWRINSFDFGSVVLTLATGLTKIILLFACFYVIFLSYKFVNYSPYFNIDEVAMVGNKRISNEALNTWIGTIVGRNIFQLNLDEISQRLTEHPWVQSASVGRVFPQAIYIELKERTPFAKIQLENIYVMDNYGVLLGTEVDSQNKLPTITGIKIKNAKLGENIVDQEIIDGLKMMHSLNQLSMFEEKNIENVHISSRSRMIFSTHNQDTKIHIRPEIAQESFKNLVLALDAIQKNGQDLSYIDLSFKNKIILNN